MNKFRAVILSIVFALATIPGFHLGRSTSLAVYPFFRQIRLSNASKSALSPQKDLPAPSATPQKYTRRFETPRATATPTVREDQEKLLLIQADNLNSEQPQLISMWGIFISFSNHPHIIFKAIYPSQEEPSSIRGLKNDFIIESGGDLPTSSLANLEAMDIEWDGYVLVDEVFIEQFRHTYLQAPIAASSFAALDSESALLSPEVFLNETCRFLKDNDRGVNVNFDWITAGSGHLQSDLRLDSLMQGWHQLLNNSILENCEVLR